MNRSELKKEHEDTRKKVESLDDKEMLIQMLRDKRVRAQRLNREIWTLEYQIEHFDEIQNYFKPPDPSDKNNQKGEDKNNSGGSGGEG